MAAVGLPEIERFLAESLAHDQFYEQLETWGIDPEVFGGFLSEYSTHAGAYHSEHATTPEEIVLVSLVAGFEIGYRARLHVETVSEQVAVPDVMPG